MQELYDARIATIIPMIEKTHGKARALNYLLYDNVDLKSVIDAELYALNKLDIAFGQCMQLSALLCALLNGTNNIPAVLVAGDLIIEDKKIFVSNQDIEPLVKLGKNINLTDWPGHSWVEIGHYIFDISLIRSSTKTNDSASGKFFKSYISSNFDINQEYINLTLEELKLRNIMYQPKEVLSETTIDGLLLSANLI